MFNDEFPLRSQPFTAMAGFFISAIYAIAVGMNVKDEIIKVTGVFSSADAYCENDKKERSETYSEIIKDVLDKLAVPMYRHLFLSYNGSIIA